MKIGLIARADDRGLGTLTWEFHNHMRPAKTLVVLTGDADFPEHPERYQHGVVDFVRLGPFLSLDEGQVRQFLEGLDVVYTAETFYDWRILEWATQMNVVTVCHGMPELTIHARKRNLRHPDQWWWPTDWMLDWMPVGWVMPIPGTPHPQAADPYDEGPLRVLHPGGKMALKDRDGTNLFLDALLHVTEPVVATVFTQDRSFGPSSLPSNVQVEFGGPVADRWDIYTGHHVTVLPRRYGGLSLKVHESLDSGIPVVMPDVSPNERWPGPRVPAMRGQKILVPSGLLQTHNADPVAIAAEIDRLAANPARLHREHVHAAAWSADNSWGKLGPEYERAFADLL